MFIRRCEGVFRGSDCEFEGVIEWNGLNIVECYLEGLNDGVGVIGIGEYFEGMNDFIDEFEEEGGL